MNTFETVQELAEGKLDVPESQAVGIAMLALVEKLEQIHQSLNNIGLAIRTHD